jgi:hypothetical protein
MVVVIEAGDYQYQVLSPLFNDYGYGFVAPDQKLIFIDGNQHKDVHKIVEAHEVGHIVMEHGKHSDPIYEAEADTWAILKLRKCGYHKHANILMIQFEGRHGYSFYHKKNSQTKTKIYGKL